MTLVAPIPAGISQRLAALLLVASLLPQVLYLDHQFSLGASEHSHEGSASGYQGPDDDADHSLHCHGSSGSCSNLPMPAGPGQLLFSDQLLVQPALAELGLSALANERNPGGRDPSLIERPPKASLLLPQ